MKLLRQPWLYSRLGFLLDRHANKLFLRDTVRDQFLRHLPTGVTYPWEQASRKSLGVSLESDGAGNTRTVRQKSYTDMKFDAAHLHAITSTTGFPPDSLEKVLRLRELLTNVANKSENLLFARGYPQCMKGLDSCTVRAQ